MREKYLERFYAGETLAASRLMSLVEKGGEEAEAILTQLFPRTGHAYRVGVTGLTGAGKSTLISALIRRYREKKLTVGVVAEDPTSPFSGGAILGDRVRMQDTAGDEGVFIRSIASRGNETGLSASAVALADVLDAFGRDVILLETIGIGQLEYRIGFSAHTTVVVLTPDAGGEVQSLKSGLMEIGDLFVVNKADRTHGSRYADGLRSMLELRSVEGAWLPQVVETVATRDEGVDELVRAIDTHRSYLAQNGRMEKKRTLALRNRTTTIVEQKLKEFFWENTYIKDTLDRALQAVVAGRKSPYEAAGEIVEPLRIEKKKGGTR